MKSIFRGFLPEQGVSLYPEDIGSSKRSEIWNEKEEEKFGLLHLLFSFVFIYENQALETETLGKGFILLVQDFVLVLISFEETRGSFHISPHVHNFK